MKRHHQSFSPGLFYFSLARSRGLDRHRLARLDLGSGESSWPSQQVDLHEVTLQLSVQADAPTAASRKYLRFKIQSCQVRNYFIGTTIPFTFQESEGAFKLADRGSVKHNIEKRN